MNAAELLVLCLENKGVTRIFGVPGEENAAFMMALETPPSSSCSRATNRAQRSWPRFRRRSQFLSRLEIIYHCTNMGMTLNWHLEAPARAVIRIPIDVLLAA